MDWQPATLIEINSASKDVYSLLFKVSRWKKHFPGQHYDIRLTAENGYQAERSYSIASSPNEKDLIEFGVQLLDDGEVSPYLVNQLQIGEQIEVKGPLGGHFIWDITMPGPLLLIAGGSGVVPFLSMIRYYKENLKTISRRPVILLLSAQDQEHTPFYQEFREMSERGEMLKVILTLTRMFPTDWRGYKRRIDKEMLREAFGEYLDQRPMIFICGSDPFVENVANRMVDLGFQSHFIKTERFGG